MRSLGTYILCAFAVSATGAYFRHHSTPEIPENAPPGAIAYLETEDHLPAVILYRDRLVVKSSGSTEGPATIPISQIKSVRKYGSMLIFNTPDGKVELSLIGSLDNREARGLTEKLQALIANN